jgi:hypothetical protein
MIDGIIDGVITYAYPMTSCPINGIPSDELIEFARLYLSQNIPHSATCAIGKSIRRIKSDWMLLFPDAKPPRMIVSWSDTTRHKGTIYKAANFTWLKKSRSLGIPHSEKSKRGKRISTPDRLNEKDCWIYMLSD